MAFFFGENSTEEGVYKEGRHGRTPPAPLASHRDHRTAPPCAINNNEIQYYRQSCDQKSTSFFLRGIITLQPATAGDARHHRPRNRHANRRAGIRGIRGIRRVDQMAWIWRISPTLRRSDGVDLTAGWRRIAGWILPIGGRRFWGIITCGKTCVFMR